MGIAATTGKQPGIYPVGLIQFGESGSLGSWNQRRVAPEIIPIVAEAGKKRTTAFGLPFVFALGSWIRKLVRAENVIRTGLNKGIPDVGPDREKAFW